MLMLPLLLLLLLLMMLLLLLLLLLDKQARQLIFKVLNFHVENLKYIL